MPTMRQLDERLLNAALQLREKLRGRGKTVATAESLTAGLISSTIASVSGASEYLRGGIVAYHIDPKVGLLEVDRDVAEESNCVSPTVANHMALGAHDQFGVDITIACTGYAEPPERGILPHAWVTVFVGGELDSFQVVGDMTDTRNTMRAKVAAEAIERLVSVLGDG